MANSSSDSLHELIHNLSKTEKRFFKLFASRHTIGKENNAIILFDFISKMKVYDEKMILKKFKGAAFLNKFSITKYRLYHQILDSLNLYHAKSSPENELSASLQSAKMLFEKGLYTQSKKVLDGVIKKADKYHLTNIKWQALQLIRKYHEQHFYTSLSFTDFEDLKKSDEKILNDTAVKTELWHIKSVLFKKINYFGTIRSNDQIMVLNAIIKPILQMNFVSDNVENIYLYHHTLSAYYFAIYDTEKCHQHLKETFNIYDQNKELIKKETGKYLSTLTNLAYTSIKLKLFKEADVYIDKLEKEIKIFKKNQDLEIKYFSSYYSLKLFIGIENGGDENALEIINTIESGIKDYKHKINPVRQAYLFFQMGVYYLSNHAYKKALYCINQVVNDKQNLAKEDIYSFAQILQLIIHFELKNYRYLPYVLTNTKRFLKDKQRHYQFEALFLKIIGKIKSDQITDIELEEILLEFEPEIDKLRQDKFEKAVFEYFDFGAWLNSKIYRKTYLEIKKASA